MILQERINRESENINASKMAKTKEVNHKNKINNILGKINSPVFLEESAMQKGNSKGLTSIPKPKWNNSQKKHD